MDVCVGGSWLNTVYWRGSMGIIIQSLRELKSDAIILGCIGLIVIETYFGVGFDTLVKEVALVFFVKLGDIFVKWIDIKLIRNNESHEVTATPSRRSILTSNHGYKIKSVKKPNKIDRISRGENKINYRQKGIKPIIKKHSEGRNRVAITIQTTLNMYDLNIIASQNFVGTDIETNEEPVSV